MINNKQEITIKRIKKLVYLFIIVFTLAFISTQAKAADDINNVIKNSYKVISNSMKKGESSGSAFNVGNYIVTNKHVIDGAQVIRLVNASGKTVRAKLIDVSDKYDLALLQKVNSGSIKLCDNSDVNIGHSLYNFGNPMGQEFIYTRGYVSGVKRILKGSEKEGKYMVQNLIGVGGQSGSAMLDAKKNCVLGVLTKGYTGAMLGFSIPVETLKEYINEYENKKSTMTFINSIKKSITGE
jgi:S1-C subfamily serine protease